MTPRRRLVLRTVREARHVYAIAPGNHVDVYPCGSWRQIDATLHRILTDYARRKP